MNSGWMRRIRSAAAMLALAGGLWASGAGAAEVKNVTAKYAWPWGVGLSYEVSGTIPAYEPLFIWAKDKTRNATYYSMSNTLTGDTGKAAGKHQVVWDLDRQGLNLQSTNVTFTVAYEWPLYCVVDLSAGANAASYPVTYMTEPPSGGFNTDEYKTTKLVLRRIDAGTFTMGDKDQDDNQPHQVTLSRPFYIGVFEVTQKQYQMVTGSNPSYYSGDKRPVEMVSWNTIRGDINWPGFSFVSESSFMGRLRARTGLVFDLPTEAQWEYACRAGTTTAFSCDASEIDDYMWYSNSSGTHEVGTKKPNPWGLYDMHGNILEWCLDWYASSLSDGTDPKGPSSGVYRVMRGGSWGSWAYFCFSYWRRYEKPSDPNKRDGFYGFRIVRTLPE